MSLSRVSARCYLSLLSNTNVSRVRTVSSQVSLLSSHGVMSFDKSDPLLRTTVEMSCLAASFEKAAGLRYYASRVSFTMDTIEVDLGGLSVRTGNVIVLTVITTP